MSKLKTRKAILKRFKRTKGGKIKRARAGKGHLLTGKSPKRKRFLRGKDTVIKAEADRIKRQMPGW